MADFDKCYEELKKQTKDLEVTPQNLMKVLQFAMEHVETIDLKGVAQKELVEKLVKQLIVDAPITDLKEKLLLDMIEEGILGDVASLVVSATKGELNVNAMAEVAGVCCKSCFGGKK